MSGTGSPKWSLTHRERLQGLLELLEDTGHVLHCENITAGI